VTLGFTLTPTFLWDLTSWRPRLPILQYYVGYGASAARCLGLSSSHWCRGLLQWMVGTWRALHYTLHGACNHWWTRLHESSSNHQSATTSRRSYANYTGWQFHSGEITSWPFWFTNVFTAWRRHTSLADELHHPTESGVSKASAFRFVSQTVCSPYPTPNLQLFQLPLYGSGTVFRSISHLLHHFLSSALTWRHTSSNSVTRNYCCRAREVTLSFMDTLIALTYIFTIPSLGTFSVFAFHSNYGPTKISYQFRDKVRYWSINCDFSCPCIQHLR